jgi:hypothetical protein
MPSSIPYTGSPPPVILVTRAPCGIRRVTPRLSSRVGDGSSPSVGADTEGFTDPELAPVPGAAAGLAGAPVVDDRAFGEFLCLSVADWEPLRCTGDLLLLALWLWVDPAVPPWIAWGLPRAACEGARTAITVASTTQRVRHPHVLGPDRVALMRQDAARIRSHAPGSPLPGPCSCGERAPASIAARRGGIRVHQFTGGDRSRRHQ